MIVVLESLEFLALALLAALALSGFLGQKDGVNVGQNTARGDGNTAEKLVQLLVIADSELDVARNDAGLLVVAGGVTGKLENLGGQVLEHSTEVNRCSSADARGILALLQIAVNTTDGKLETRLLGARDGLAALGLATTCCAFACLS
jgi:hypothetical protein